MTKHIVLGAVIGAVLVAGAAFLVKPSFSAPMFERTKWVSDYFAVGTSEQFHVDESGNATTTGSFVVGGATRVETFTEGGGITATSSYGSNTMLATEIDVENMYEYTPLTYQPTLTTPASSSLSVILPNAGDHRSLLVCNASSTALKNGQFTLAAGTGINFAQATGTSVVYSGQCGLLELFRASDTDIEAFWHVAL